MGAAACYDHVAVGGQLLKSKIKDVCACVCNAAHAVGSALADVRYISHFTCQRSSTRALPTVLCVIETHTLTCTHPCRQGCLNSCWQVAHGLTTHSQTFCSPHCHRTACNHMHSPGPLVLLRMPTWLHASSVGLWPRPSSNSLGARLTHPRQSVKKMFHGRMCQAAGTSGQHVGAGLAVWDQAPGAAPIMDAEAAANETVMNELHAQAEE